jgi:Magnesium chelatase, subunit ChlI
VRRGWPAPGRELPLVTEGFDIPALPGAKRYLTNGHEMALSWLGSLPSRFSSGAIGLPRGTSEAKCHAGVQTQICSCSAPGAGQSMLARRLTTILPAMTLAEAIETTRIHSVAGLTGDRTAWVTTRPFRAPHHTSSYVGLIGRDRGLRLSCGGLRSPPRPDLLRLMRTMGLEVAGNTVVASRPHALAPPP